MTRKSKNAMPVATPDRQDLIHTASLELSAISICLSAMGRELIVNSKDPNRHLDGTGHALEWLGSEIERRCALIDEVLS